MVVDESENTEDEVTFQIKAFDEEDEEENICLVLELLRNDIDLNKCIGVKESRMLLYAVQYNKKELVELLLNNQMRVDEENEDRVTALMMAVQNGNKEIINILIERGANIDKKDKEGATVLMRAISMQNEETTHWGRICRQ